MECLLILLRFFAILNQHIFYFIIPNYLKMTVFLDCFWADWQGLYNSRPKKNMAENKWSNFLKSKNFMAHLSHKAENARP